MNTGNKAADEAIEKLTPTEKAEEPAVSIGNIFASKTMIQPYVAAAVGLVAQAFQFTVDNGTVDSITLLVTLMAMGYAAWSANREKAQRAEAQASATREVVYAPASVDKIAQESAEAGRPIIPPPPAENVLRVRRVSRKLGDDSRGLLP